MKKILFAMLCAAMVMVSCGDSKKIDEAITKWENAVNEYAQKFEDGTITPDDDTKMAALIQEVQPVLIQEDKMSDEQKAKCKAATDKYNEVQQKALQKLQEAAGQLQESGEQLEQAAGELQEAVEGAAEGEEATEEEEQN